MAGEGGDWVLWDGDCSFCRRWAQWAEREVLSEPLRFVTYREAPSPPMNPVLRAACADSLHVITASGTVLRGAAAVLYVLQRTRWRLLARVLGWPPLAGLAEAAYRWVARSRRCRSPKP